MGEVEKSLGNLAEEINAEHRACEEAVTSALEHAIVAGGMLSEVKAGLPHGAWGSWVEGNFEGSARTAQAYMRLHRRRDEIRNGAADLSVRGALAALAEPAVELPALPAAVLKRCPFLAGWDNSEAVELTAQRLDDLPEGRRRGFLREFAIADAVWVDYQCARMFEELMNAARDEYGIDSATFRVGDVDRPFKVLGKLYPERYEAVIRKAGENEALRAELDRLEEEICPADVPPGRERGALRSMLPEEEMTTSFAELRRQAKLEQPIRLPAPLSLDWIDHAFLALGYGSVENREEE